MGAWVRMLGAVAITVVAGIMHGEADTVGTTMTIATYNIRIGVPMERKEWLSSEADLHNTAAVLAPPKPDVVALQEVDCEYGAALDPNRRRTGCVHQPRVLARLLNMRYAFGSAQDDIAYPSDNAEYVEWGDGEQAGNNGGRHGEVGNCLLSRLPFRVPPENVPLPRKEKEERRAALRVELLHPDGAPFTPPVVVYTTHLQHNSEESRASQMKALLDRAARESAGTTVFILGDLNAQPEPGGSGQPSAVFAPVFAAGYRDLAADFAAAAATKPQPTFPADKPRRRIDLVLCNKKVKVHSVDVPAALASDHRPVVVTLELPK